MNAPRAYPGTADSSDPHGAGHAYATKRTFESEYKEKIRERLSMYPGAVVGVNVHLEAPVPASSELGSGERGLRRSLAPTLVTASIDLPKSYFRKVWRERNPKSDDSPPDPVAIERIEQEIKEKVERAVLALLPPPAPQWNTGAQVAVTSYDDSSPTAAPELSRWMEASAWIAEHWQVVALGLTILLGILLFRGRSVQSPRKHVRAAETADRASWSQPSEASERSTTPDPRGELSRRVAEDPDAAAEVLKRWLHKAA
jgi:hypothetical protein